MNTLEPKLVDSNGFEPLRFLQNGFTVRRLQPLGQLSFKLEHPRLDLWQQVLFGLACRRDIVQPL